MDKLNESIYWKRIAIYLAEYHAANLGIAELKSCPKYQKERLRNIMDHAADFLDGKKFPHRIGNYTTEENLERVITRCKKNAKEIDKIL